MKVIQLAFSVTNSFLNKCLLNILYTPDTVLDARIQICINYGP